VTNNARRTTGQSLIDHMRDLPLEHLADLLVADLPEEISRLTHDVTSQIGVAPAEDAEKKHIGAIGILREGCLLAPRQENKPGLQLGLLTQPNLDESLSVDSCGPQVLLKDALVVGLSFCLEGEE